MQQKRCQILSKIKPSSLRLCHCLRKCDLAFFYIPVSLSYIPARSYLFVAGHQMDLFLLLDFDNHIPLAPDRSEGRDQKHTDVIQCDCFFTQEFHNAVFSVVVFFFFNICDVFFLCVCLTGHLLFVQSDIYATLTSLCNHSHVT